MTRVSKAASFDEEHDYGLADESVEPLFGEESVDGRARRPEALMRVTSRAGAARR